ncbi:hypothetical protein N8T08_001825 [Aspergillus melleus]|uniref:Uncharacterized protein n=1 Tax=Aspergillus melleus TaxID=138277 RepID=A0ACC3B9I5_9EURO|nr:hypothetical protein N8T08_001825 [Aspergillus melleus]
MAEKTNKLMTQFKVMKSELQKPRHNASGAVQDETCPFSSDTPLSTSTSSRHSSNVSSSRLSRSKERKKRRGHDEVNAVHNDDPSGMSRSQKRKRVDVTLPGDDESVRNVTPVSMETEDISEEVQRRLKIKEEQKKRKANPEKRKRDSLASNGSVSSPGSTSKPKKKAKLTKGRAGDEETLSAAGNSTIRIRRFDGISDPDSTTAALRGTKRQKQKPDLISRDVSNLVRWIFTLFGLCCEATAWLHLTEKDPGAPARVKVSIILSGFPTTFRLVLAGDLGGTERTEKVASAKASLRTTSVVILLRVITLNCTPTSHRRPNILSENPMEQQILTTASLLATIEIGNSTTTFLSPSQSIKPALVALETPLSFETQTATL